MKVSTGQSFDDFLNGEMSIRVMDEDGARIYKMKSCDLKAVYDSIKREVMDKIERNIREMPGRLTALATEVGGLADSANDAAESIAACDKSVTEKSVAE